MRKQTARRKLFAVPPCYSCGKTYTMQQSFFKSHQSKVCNPSCCSGLFWIPHIPICGPLQKEPVLIRSLHRRTSAPPSITSLLFTAVPPHPGIHTCVSVPFYQQMCLTFECTTTVPHVCHCLCPFLTI